MAAQYPDEYEKTVPEDLAAEQKADAERKLLEHITKELVKARRMDPTTGHPVGGLLDVLRKGFSYAQVGRRTAKFGPMMAFPPANPNLTEVIEAADSVRLRILRQVRFDTEKAPSRYVSGSVRRTPLDAAAERHLGSVCPSSVVQHPTEQPHGPAGWMSS